MRQQPLSRAPARSRPKPKEPDGTARPALSDGGSTAIARGSYRSRSGNLFLPRIAPQDARSPQTGSVELLMVERKGAEPNEAGQRQQTSPAATPATETTGPPAQETQKTDAPAEAAKATLAPPDNGEEPTPGPSNPGPTHEAVADSKPTAKPAETRPPRAPSQDAPVFNLDGTESESNATALGPHILPANAGQPVPQPPAGLSG